MWRNDLVSFVPPRFVRVILIELIFKLLNSKSFQLLFEVVQLIYYKLDFLCRCRFSIAEDFHKLASHCWSSQGFSARSLSAAARRVSYWRRMSALRFSSAWATKIAPESWFWASLSSSRDRPLKRLVLVGVSSTGVSSLGVSCSLESCAFLAALAARILARFSRMAGLV